MTDTTLNLQMPLLFEGSKKGNITQDELSWMLDWAAKGELVTATATTAEPGSPTSGDAYLTGASATGTHWSGHNSQIAVYSGISAGWFFFTPPTGMRFYARDTLEQLGWHATYGFYPVQQRLSTTEYWTGRFHGGTGSTNRVFGKLISIGAMPNSTSKNVAHGITNLDRANPITVIGWAGKSTDGFSFPQSFATGIIVTVNVDGTNVTVFSSSNLSGYTGYVLLLYRKT